ncbi:MAG: hypothetical protein IJ230_07670 [Clostridia bacterium]|nr:hypothetical protein [Clostridia bacterium]
MKKSTKIVSVLLTLIMLVGVVSNSSFAVEKESKEFEYDMYLSFGDSISSGYFLISKEEMLEGSSTKFLAKKTFDDRIPGSYADLVGKAVGLGPGAEGYYKFARDGMSALSMTRIVDPEFEEGISGTQRNGDDLLWASFTEDGVDTLQKLRKRYRSILENAKGKRVLVTTMVGANDLVIGPLMDAYFILKDAIAGGQDHRSLVVNFDDAFLGAMAEGDVPKAIDLVETVANVVLAQPEILLTVLDDELNSYFRYFDRMDAFFNAIHDDFTKAGVAQLDVVAVGLYNPTKELRFDDILDVRAGKIMWWFTKLMNNYLSGQAVTRVNAPYENGYYKYAYARDTETNEWPSFITWPLYGQEFLRWMMFCVHPTAAGHEYIAKQVLDTLRYGSAEVTYDHEGYTPFLV